jgi:microcystin-dependent protein
MSLPIYANMQYIGLKHIFNTIPNNINTTLTNLSTISLCNVMTLVNGNIGLGTTFPLQSLHVQNLSFFNGNIGIGITYPLHSLHVKNSSYFAGNVGIGTLQPNTLLHVNGDILSPVLVSQVAFFATSNAPIGWLKCNGTSISRSIYADLFNEIGTTFGIGDNTSTFGLPDLRGEFIRAWNESSGMDSGRIFGSAQSAAMLDHTHSGTTNSGEGTHTHTITDPGHNHTYIRYSTSAGLDSDGLFYVLRGADTNNTGRNTTGISIDTTNSAHIHTMTTGNPSTGGGTETRPRNIALLACIKY